eukprot:m.274586 g.274586  ORF g.274586 m.274586 type:complete len:297 (+) comp54835_c1_seq6:54-944(+)
MFTVASTVPPADDYDDHTDDLVPCMYTWADRYLGTCVKNDLQVAALFCGLLSIACWMVAQLPQLIKNFRTGDASSLSLIFLADWLCGDVTNLVGVLLTLSHHVKTQLYIAIYYVIIDSSMLAQFLYYQAKLKRSRKHPALMFVPIIALAAVFFIAQHVLDTSALEGVAHHGRTLLKLSSFGNAQSIAGYILGWISGLMYFTSRIPQIRKNYKRKSTEGLALQMFVMAVLGNSLYTLSIFFQSHEKGFLISNLPWLLGSAGTLCFDFTIFGQFLLYRNRSGGAEAQPLLQHPINDED